MQACTKQTLTGKSEQVRPAARDSIDRGRAEISVKVTFDTMVKTILHVRNIVSNIQSAYNEYVPRKMGEESRPRFRNKGEGICKESGSFEAET